MSRRPMLDYPDPQEARRAAEAVGVEFRLLNSGRHWQFKGRRTVNYYPSVDTIYINENDVKSVGSFITAIELTEGPRQPGDTTEKQPPNRKKRRRRRGSRPTTPPGEPRQPFDPSKIRGPR